MMPELKQFLFRQGCQWLLPVGLLICWWQGSIHGWMSVQILPSPGTVLDTARTFIPQDLLDQLPVSLWRLAIGLIGGIVVGILLGCLLGLSHRANHLLMPLFTVLVQIPTLAWIPLLMLWLGIGDALKLTLLIKAVTVPVALYISAGIGELPPKLREMAYVLRLPVRVYLCRVVVPALLPFLMTGIRLAFSQGWVSLIAVELLASSEGLGYLLVESRQLFMLDQVYICVIVIGLLGFVAEKGLQWLSDRWIHWPSPVAGAVTLPPTRLFDLTGWLLPCGLLVVWQVASGEGWLNNTFFPAPFQVTETLLAGLIHGQFSQDLYSSILRMLQGFAIGAVTGGLCGLATGGLPWVDRLVTPLFSGLRSVAIFAWLPLITAWFGLGETARLAFIAITSFFPVLLSTHQAVVQLPPVLLETSNALRLPPISKIRYLILPGVLPGLFTGLRLGMMHAWVGTIGAEYFISSGEGIGSMIMRAQQLMAADRVMAGIVLIAAVAAVISFLIRRLEQRLMRWRYQ